MARIIDRAGREFVTGTDGDDFIFLAPTPKLQRQKVYGGAGDDQIFLPPDDDQDRAYGDNEAFGVVGNGVGDDVIQFSELDRVTGGRGADGYIVHGFERPGDPFSAAHVGRFNPREGDWLAMAGDDLDVLRFTADGRHVEAVTLLEPHTGQKVEVLFNSAGFDLWLDDRGARGIADDVQHYIDNAGWIQ